MFGLKEEVIAGLLAVALLVLAGFAWYVRHLASENTRLHAQTALLEASVKGHEQAERELRQADAQKEAADVQNARERAALAAQLRTSRQQFQAMVALSPEVRAWADAVLPGDVAARLRARSRERAAAGAEGAAAERPAAGNAGP